MPHNVMSRELVNRYRGIFRIKPVQTIIIHSTWTSREKETEGVFNAEVKIGHHRYKSNWVLADGRYDIVIGRGTFKRVLIQIINKAVCW